MGAARGILHVDMDAFFAAVEILDDPALKGRCVIVGGAADRRGVVAAASYEARAFGVHSAMPTATALRLCPQAVLVAPRHDRYAEVSGTVMGLLRSFTPLLEQISVDEAFLDVTASRALFGDPPAIGRTIKARVRAETGLTCSIGVAPNKFLAKLASDLEKPNGLTVVPPDAAAFLAPMPVRRIWGVGPRTAEVLAELGIGTIGQLAAFSPGPLARRLGSWAGELQALARGEDDAPVEPEREAKGMSRETTFAEFLSDPEAVDAALLALADDVGARLREERLVARTVTLKVRDETFSTRTRSATLAEPTDLGEVLYARARALFKERVDLRGRKVRLLGVGAEGLEPADRGQLGLFADRRTDRARKAAQAVDRIRARHGDRAVTRGKLLGSRTTRGRNPWEGAR